MEVLLIDYYISEGVYFDSDYGKSNQVSLINSFKLFGQPVLLIIYSVQQFHIILFWVI